MRIRRKDPDRDDARAAALRTYGPGTMIFADLDVGDRFRFASSPSTSVCVKIRRRRYVFDGRVCYARLNREVVRASLPAPGDVAPE